MKRLNLILAMTLFSAVTAFCQKTDQGAKFLEYGKLRSAIHYFDSLYKAEPTNISAAYFLAKSYIKNKEPQEALRISQTVPDASKKLLMKAVMAEAYAAKGNKEASGKLLDPRYLPAPGTNVQKMEAIALADALNALGRYKEGTEYLQEAEKTFPGDPQLLVAIADTYFKRADGSAAFKYYTKAVIADSTFAPAYLGFAKIFRSQNNRQKYVSYLLKSVWADSLYAPGWYELYSDAYYHDKANLKKYYGKYLEVSDKTADQKYRLLVIDYEAKKYQKVISRGKALLAQPGANPPAKVYRYLGYSYYMNKDIPHAYESMLTYIKTADSSSVKDNDYYLIAQFAARLKQKDSVALHILEHEFSRDTILKNKLFYGQALAAHYGMLHDGERADLWKENLLPLQGNDKQALYAAGLNRYNKNDWVKADSLFRKFNELYPGEYKGIYMQAGINTKLDSTGAAGLAVPYFKAFIDSAENNMKDEYRPMLIQSYLYLGNYYLSKKAYRNALKYYEPLVGKTEDDRELKKTISGIKKYISESERFKKENKSDG